MYVETDTTNHVIIQDIKVDEAELLTSCIDAYFVGKELQKRSPEEKCMIALRDGIREIIKKKHP